MGNSTSSLTVSIETISQIISSCYLAISQDIAQGLSAQQIISVSCDDEKSKKLCNDCIDNLLNVAKRNNVALPPENIESTCAGICECQIGNVKLGEQISMDSTIFMQSVNQQKFVTMVINSLAQEVSQNASSFFAAGDRVQQMTKTINDLYNSMRTTSFQTAVNGLRNLQTISLEGPGKVFNVDMTQAVNYVSRILQIETTTASILDQLQNNIITITTQVASAGLAELILWIVRIVMLLLAIIVLIYAISLVFQIYSLYV